MQNQQGPLSRCKDGKFQFPFSVLCFSSCPIKPTFILASLYHLSLIADNVELTSNKQGRFTCPGDQVTFTCRVFGSFSLEWRSPLITRTASFIASNSFPRSLDRGPFTASLINVSTNGTFTNANFTSTLQVTASRMIMRDATTVMCLSTTANETDNFTVAGNFCCIFKYARESVYNCVYMGSYMCL